MKDKCDACGKFKKVEKGCSTTFVPDSALTVEEFGFRCKECTNKHGIIPAPQGCVTSYCSEII